MHRPAVIDLGRPAYWSVILNPANGFLDESKPTPFLTTIGLFVAFGAASILFWAWFRLRPAPAGPGEAAGPGRDEAAASEAAAQP